MRVHITDVRSGDLLTEDIFNSFGLHVLSKGSTLNERELSRLYQHQVDFVEIERKADIPPSSGPSGSSALLKPLYNDAIAGAGQLFERALAEGKIHENEIQESFQPLVDNIKTERDVVSLLLLLNTQDDYTYQHSVQVGMLSYYIAKWLGWSEEDTVRAGKAGFLHDVGKCKVSDTILNKPGRLTEEEFDEVKNHSKFGYDILKNSIDDAGVALAALQHHERMDGSGYPLGLKDDQIHPLARIVAVADVYSAMTSFRVYREKRDLLITLKELHEMSFRQLDPEITHTFIRHMLPNFIGKRVELTNGQYGTIVLTNPTDYFRPLIQLDDGRFLDLATDRKLEIKHIHM